LKFNPLYLLLVLFISFAGFSQTAKVKGVVLNNNDLALADVVVTVGNTQATTNANGFYIIEVTAEQTIVVSFTHVGYQAVKILLSGAISFVRKTSGTSYDLPF